MEKVFVKYSDVLKSLEEYEKTGRAKKIGGKKRYNFTLDADMMKKFRIYCHKKSMKMSTAVEGMIKKEVNAL